MYVPTLPVFKSHLKTHFYPLAFNSLRELPFSVIVPLSFVWLAFMAFVFLLCCFYGFCVFYDFVLCFFCVFTVLILWWYFNQLLFLNVLYE